MSLLLDWKEMVLWTGSAMQGNGTRYQSRRGDPETQSGIGTALIGAALIRVRRGTLGGKMAQQVKALATKAKPEKLSLLLRIHMIEEEKLAPKKVSFGLHMLTITQE